MLGADAVGMAGTILHALLHHSDEEVIQLINDWQTQLQLLMALVGATSVPQLHALTGKLSYSPELVAYKQSLNNR